MPFFNILTGATTLAMTLMEEPMNAAQNMTTKESSEWNRFLRYVPWSAKFKPALKAANICC